MLTARQSELVAFIERYLKEFGYAPTYEDMRIALRLASKSGISRLIDQLVVRGALRKLAGRERAIEVVRPELQVKIDGRIAHMRVVPFVEVSP